MARAIYGHGSFDYVAQISSDGDYEPSAGTFDVFTTRTGSTQHTSLLNMAGGAITAVTPDANGWIRFQGQDTYLGSYWLQNQATPSNPRWRCDPVGMAERLIAVETGGGVGVTDGDKGDITVSSSGTVWNIDADTVGNTELANMAQATFKGRASGAGTGDPTDLTAAQARTILNVADGATAGVTDGDKGDITVSGTGTVWNIDVGVVTPTELDNSTAIEVLYTGTAWPAYSTDPAKVRRFRSEPYSAAAAPTAYNVYDSWLRS